MIQADKSKMIELLLEARLALEKASEIVGLSESRERGPILAQRVIDLLVSVIDFPIDLIRWKVDSRLQGEGERGKGEEESGRGKNL